MMKLVSSIVAVVVVLCAFTVQEGEIFELLNCFKNKIKNFQLFLKMNTYIGLLIFFVHVSYLTKNNRIYHLILL